MCQLTYIDFRKDVYLSPWFVKWLVVANALEGHKDGFGYFLEKDNTLVKTEKSATEWMDKNFIDQLSSIRNTNGIYHVRRASVNFKEIKQCNAHPFREGNIVLAHNGTLELQFVHLDQGIDKKMFTDDMIDSQKFLTVLSYFVKKNKGVLDEKIIKQAIMEFSGTYVLLIRDITTNTLWIAKDDTKELSIALFTNWGEPCGIIINTRHYMLNLITDIILDSKRNTGLGCNLLVFNKDMIMKYELGSYVTPTNVMDFRTPVKRYGAGVIPATKATGSVHVGGIVEPNRKDGGVQSSFFEDMKKCFLTLEDLFLLYEVQFGKSVLEMSEADYPELMKLVGHIAKTEWTERRAESLKVIFGEAENSIMSPIFNVVPVDKKIEVTFPLISNGKALLEAVAKKFQPKAKGLVN